MYANMAGGRRHQTEVRLGGAGVGGLTLRQAREPADTMRRARGEDKDLKTQRRVENTAQDMSTFGGSADEYIARSTHPQK